MLYDTSFEFSEDEAIASIPRNPMCLLEWLRRNQPNVFAPDIIEGTSSEAGALPNFLGPASGIQTVLTSVVPTPVSSSTSSSSSSNNNNNGASSGSISINGLGSVPGLLGNFDTEMILKDGAIPGTGVSSALIGASVPGSTTTPTGKQRRKRKASNIADLDQGGGGGAVESKPSTKKTKKPRKNSSKNSRKG